MAAYALQRPWAQSKNSERGRSAQAPWRNIRFYSKGILQLFISSLSKEYKRAGVRLEMMLGESHAPHDVVADPTQEDVDTSRGNTQQVNPHKCMKE